jgi:hypothetical protein
MKLSTRLALAMVALVLLTAAIVGAITSNVAELALPRALDRIDMQAHIIAIKLEGSVAARAATLAPGGRRWLERMPMAALVQRMERRASV